MGLRVNIKGLRFRTTDGKLNPDDKMMRLQLRLTNRDCHNAIRAGDCLNDLTWIHSKRQFSTVTVTAAGDIPKLEIPEMLDVPGTNYMIMQSLVTVGLFKQFVNTGYEITGHNANKLRQSLEGKPGNTLGNLNLVDGMMLARELSMQTGKKFRIPTTPEMDSAVDQIGKNLSGNKYAWTLMTDKDANFFDNINFMIHLKNEGYLWGSPLQRYDIYSVRLIQDK